MRRLLALVRGLPPGSALHRELDPQGWDWSYSEELLASVIEVVDAGNRMFFSANTKKGTRGPKPVDIKRPWQRQADGTTKLEPRKQATHSEIMAFFGGGDG